MHQVSNFCKGCSNLWSDKYDICLHTDGPFDVYHSEENGRTKGCPLEGDDLEVAFGRKSSKYEIAEAHCVTHCDSCSAVIQWFGSPKECPACPKCEFQNDLQKLYKMMLLRRKMIWIHEKKKRPFRTQTNIDDYNDGSEAYEKGDNLLKALEKCPFKYGMRYGFNSERVEFWLKGWTKAKEECKEEEEFSI